MVEMHNKRENTRSQMFLDKLDPNPNLGEQLFSTFRLLLRH